MSDEARTVPSQEGATPDQESVPPELEALGRVRIFEGIAPAGLRRLLERARTERRAAGDVLFEEGDPGDALYVVLEGEVRISRQVPGMGEEALAILGPGEAFGEMALVDSAPRSADAIVHRRARLLMLSSNDLEDLMLTDRDLGYEVLWNFVQVLSDRLRQTNDKMAFLSITSKF